MKSIVGISAVLLVLVAGSCDPSKQQQDNVKAAKEKNREAFDKDKESDATFIVDAVSACYSEIAMAELGLRHSRDSAFQRKLRAVESDHARILAELRAYADRQLIAVPPDEPQDEKADVRLVARENSSDFDAELCAVLRDHQEMEIRKFETCMSRTKEPELKNWIAVTLPVLNDHLKTIKDHQAKI